MKCVNNKQRVFTSMLVVLILLLSSNMVFAQSWIHTEGSETNIASGVTHQRILRFGEKGWQQINVVRVDLEDENNKLELVKSSNGVSSRDTLSNMMNQLESPIAGINADFFYLTQPDSPLGVMVKNSEIISSPVFDRPFSSLTVTYDGKADLVYWNNFSYISTKSGNLFSIEAYNKISWNYHKTTVLDSHWGKLSPGASDDYSDLVEVVVEGNTVKEVRRGLPGTEIPENGYVLLASGQHGDSLYQGIKQGEEITFYQQMNPDLVDIELAVGGGTVLVQNGRPAPFSEPVNGSHPRTAVGINRTGSEIIFVTVDGRHRSFTGVDGTMLSEIMIELGSEKAILMDGGGSTTMAVKALGSNVVTIANDPSDGSQRRIINGLAVVSTAPKGNLQGLLFQSDQNQTFVNHTIDLSVTGYDAYYQLFPLNQQQVSYRLVEGSGKIDGNRLIPESTGKIIIEAVVGDVSARKEISVLGDVAALQIHVPKYAVNPGEGLPLTVEGIDQNGYRAPLGLDRVQLTDSNGLGQFQEGVYQAGQGSGTTILKATYNGFHAAVPISVGLNKAAAGNLGQYSPTFLGYPSIVQGQVRLTSDGPEHQNAVQLDYDLTRVVETAAAYAIFDEDGIVIPNNTTRISMDVKAENTAPHWIRGLVRDGNGNAHTIDFKQGIDWTGWRVLEGNLPRGIKFPASLERVYVVETDPSYKTSGTLWFSNIAFQVPYTLPTLTQEESGGLVTDNLNRTPDQIDQQWLVYGGTSDEVKASELLTHLNQTGIQGLITGNIPVSVRSQNESIFFGGNGGYSATNVNNVMLISLNNSLDGIRKTNYQQWPWLVNALKGPLPDNIIILMPKPVFGPSGFTDELEADLLEDMLINLNQQGKNIFVLHGSDAEDEELVNGVRFIGTGKNENNGIQLMLSDRQLFYKRTSIGSSTSTTTSPLPQSTMNNVVSFKVGQRFYTLNSEQVQLDTAPYIKDSRLMIPVSHASNALGIPKEAVEWDAESETVLIRAGEGKTLLLTIGSNQLWLENQYLEMDTAAEITDSRTYIPISWFAKALSIDFSWDPATETVTFK